jgi:hypothetical protein
VGVCRGLNSSLLTHESDASRWTSLRAVQGYQRHERRTSGGTTALRAAIADLFHPPGSRRELRRPGTLRVYYRGRGSDCRRAW